MKLTPRWVQDFRFEEVTLLKIFDKKLKQAREMSCSMQPFPIIITWDNINQRKAKMIGGGMQKL